MAVKKRNQEQILSIKVFENHLNVPEKKMKLQQIEILFWDHGTFDSMQANWYFSWNIFSIIKNEIYDM